MFSAVVLRCRCVPRVPAFSCAVPLCSRLRMAARRARALLRAVRVDLQPGAGVLTTQGAQQARTLRCAAMPRGADQLPFAIAGAVATAVGAVATALLATVVVASQRAQAASTCATGSTGSKRPTKRGRLWVRERPAAWWDTTAQDFDDAEFRENFRMCWDTFYFVADTLRPQIQRQDTKWRQALGFEKVTAMALYRLATGTDARKRPAHPFSPAHLDVP